MARKRYLDGLEHAQATFRRMTPNAQAALTDALNRGGRDMVARAKALAPVDDGDLRDANRYRIEASDRRVAAVIENTDFKARWLEFGTQRMPAQPFFWPAMRGLRKRMTGRVKRALSRAAKELVRGR